MLTGIGGGDHFALFRLRKFRNGVHGCNFHLQRDGGGACVQRAPEDVREAQDVIDLVGMVGATGGDDGIAAHRLDICGIDFRVGVGQCEYQGAWCHFGDHVLLEHATSREAQKHVRALDDLAQGSSAGGLGVDDLVLVHQLGAALVHHTGQVGDIDIFAWNAQFHQQAQASQGRSASARGHQLDLLGVFAGDFQAVQDSRAHANGGAVLVVVEHRDFHALAQLALDIKAVRCLDVFQVDTAKGGLQRGDDVDQLVEVVFLIDLDVKHVDTGKLLEQHALALHHGLGGQWADVTQAQYRCAIRDDRHQVAAASVLERVVGVLDDFFARGGHAG